MKIADNGRFKIYVYSNDHNPPHCHVIASDGTKWIISIPDLKVIVGEEPPRQLKDFLLEYLEEILKTWDKFRIN